MFLKSNLLGGYSVVTLSKKGQRKTHYIHRLVGEAFIPNPNSLPQLNHKDENKANNSINNLEWCTAQYNMTYGARIERAVATRRKNRNGGY